MILVMAVADLGRRLAGRLVPVRRAVGAVHGDRRRVVVQLRAVDLEHRDHAEHELGKKRRAVTAEQSIERPADLIIAQLRHLRGVQPEQRRSNGAAHSPRL